MIARWRCSAAAAVLVAACDPGGWRIVESGTMRDLHAVFVESKDRIHIAGDDGTVLLWDGVGSVVDTSTDAGADTFIPDFYGIVGSGGEVAIAGDDGTVMTRRAATSTLSGSPYEWRFDRSNTQQRMLTMLRPAPSVFYAAGESGRVIRRNVGGREWEHVDAGAPRGAKITGGWGISRDTIVLTTDQGVVLEHVGDQWISQNVETETSTAPAQLFAVWSSTRGADLLTVGLGGAIYRRAEGAVGFEREETKVQQDLYGIYGSARDRVFAVGARGSILQYDGTTWAITPSGTSGELFAVHGLDDGSLVVAVGSRGTIVVLRGE